MNLNSKKKIFFWGGGVGSGGGVELGVELGGGQVGCERRSEVFEKIPPKKYTRLKEVINTFLRGKYPIYIGHTFEGNWHKKCWCIRTQS